MSNSPGGPVYADEGNAYLRAGFSGAAAFLGGTSFADGPFGEMQKRINKMVQEPAERFAIYVDAISRSLGERPGVSISEDDIVAMLMKIRNLQYIEKKNATAYVMGYIASSGGSKMTKSSVDKVINQVLPYSSDSSVLPPDVVRYTRLWMDL
jgi:hypothetical protein